MISSSSSSYLLRCHQKVLLYNEVSCPSTWKTLLNRHLSFYLNQKRSATSYFAQYKQENTQSETYHHKKCKSYISFHTNTSKGMLQRRYFHSINSSLERNDFGHKKYQNINKHNIYDEHIYKEEEEEEEEEYINENDINENDMNENDMDENDINGNDMDEDFDENNERIEAVEVEYEKTSFIPKKLYQGLIKTLRRVKMDSRNMQYCNREFGIKRSQYLSYFVQYRKYFLTQLLPTEKVQSALNKAETDTKVKEIIFQLFLKYILTYFEHEVVSKTMIQNLADMRRPHEWYPNARQMNRKIICHIGPTNSGKTFHAFERLAAAKSGCYLSPLRLLAAEGYDKLKKRGIACSLVTGDYKVIDENATHISCTVEMAPLNEGLDCVIIDEIQLIEDLNRGSSWTRALLGVQAKEIHICGEERALNLVKKICKDTNEIVEVKKYDRLTKLQVHETPIKHLNQLRKGDCVICFSRKEVFQLKNKIERTTGLRAAVVYGGLPPNTRLQQAQQFNDHSEYDVLVATDAIGYGLNLNIRRVIFSTLIKFDGIEERLLHPAQIRQIGGRAGRYGSLYSEGIVSSFRSSDLRLIEEAFSMKIADIKAAGLRPSIEQIQTFAEEFPKNQKLSSLLQKFEDMTQLEKKYFCCDFEDQRNIADQLHNISLSFEDRYTFMQTPIDTEDSYCMNILKKYAIAYSEGREVPVIVKPPSHFPQNIAELRDVEHIYKILEAYAWLSMRFPSSFTHHTVAEKRKDICRKMIEYGLDNLGIPTEVKRGSKARHEQQSKSSSRKHRETKRKKRDIERKLRELGLYMF